MRHLPLILAGLGCALAQSAVAADYRAPAGAAEVVPVQRVGVVVDELFVRHGRCRVDPDCIAPRVLPIAQGRRLVGHVGIAVPVDPRFARDYAR